MLSQYLAIAMFVGAVLALALGFPVAFTLAGASLLFAFGAAAFSLFDLSFLASLPSRYFGQMTNEVLVAVPLFIFMGLVLERSKLAEDLLETMGQLFGRLRGGLGISVVVVGALLAASTGIVGATVVTMGLLSLPAMMRAGYDPRLATGLICAAGTLGQIIPPSIVLVFIGDILQGANLEAQMARGNFAPDPVSVGDLFAGAFIPGVLLAICYGLYVIVLAFVRPHACPAMPLQAGGGRAALRRIAVNLLPATALIVAVLGSILSGVATATESAGVGAAGAVVLAVLRRRLSWSLLLEAAAGTVSLSAMIFLIVLGASLFSLVFRGLGGDDIVKAALSGMPGGLTGAIAVVMLVVFALGFFIDTFEIILIVVPLSAPALIFLGGDPIWLGVMLAINLQTSFLTPPFGFALFYLRGVAPAEITTGTIYRGIVPFVIIQLAMVLTIWLVPALATWLPRQVFG